MPNTILLKKSATPGAVPAAGSLTAGELALNTADGKLFTKLSSGTVVDLTGTFSGTITPRANDGAALGTGTLMWSDLFLANASVINFNNGDVLLTHSSDILRMTGGSFIAERSNASNQNAFDHTSAIEVAPASTATYSGSSIKLRSNGSNANNGSFGCLSVEPGTVSGDDYRSLLCLTFTADLNSNTKQGFAVRGHNFSTLNTFLFIDATGRLRPGTDNTQPLGIPGTAWSDLYLGSGAVIDFANGDVTILHAADQLTFDNGLYQFVRNGNQNYYNTLNVLNQNTGNAAQTGIQIGAGTSYFHLYKLGSGWAGANSGRMHFNQTPAADLAFQQANTDRFVFAADGSWYAVGAAGGAKGNQTINAIAVYDDNVLLTDYVFDHWQDGHLAPEDADNARALAFDPALLDIDVFTASCIERRALPAMLRRSEWTEEARFSIGELAQRLWEVAEVQAVHIAKLNERLKVLEAQ
jgi:hypothetical protein